MDFKVLISNLYDIKKTISQISEDFQKVEQLLQNTNFPLPVAMFCYCDDTLNDIYLYWDKWDQTDAFRLLGTKKIYKESAQEYEFSVFPISNFKVQQKIKLYPYLLKFLQVIEAESNALKLFIEENKITDIELLIKE